MKVEVWSDVVCPWCYIGKRRLEAALSRFEHAAHVAVSWRSFELVQGPATPDNRRHAERLAAKHGVSVAEAEARDRGMTATAAAEGLEMRIERTVWSNTFDAHRLLHLAGTVGLQDTLKERLFRGYFVEGARIDDHGVLKRLGLEAGLNVDDVVEVLQSDAYGQAVRADEQQASSYGINGVPFFVVDGTYGLSGAQPTDVILETLTMAWTRLVAPAR